MIAATPQRLRRAFHSGAALPGQYDGRFSLRAVRVRHDRKFADRHWGSVTPKSENPQFALRAF